MQNLLASVNVETGRSVARILPTAMTDNSPSRLSSLRQRHNPGLLIISALKLGQALLFFAVGVGALRLLHKDIGDVLEKLAYHLRFNPESRLINFLLVKSSILDERLLKRIVEVFFIYAGLDLVEGIGLYLEKTWAEIFRKLTLIRVSLLTVNILVFLYLFSLVTARTKRIHIARSNRQDS